MAEYTDPLNVILARLWTIVLERDEILEIVRPRNFQKKREKTAWAPADFPELTIIPAPGGNAQFRATTSSSRFVQNFRITIATEGLDPRKLLAAKWQLLIAFGAAGSNLGLPTLVNRTSYPDVTDVPDDLELNHSSRGWATAITASVEFSVNTTTLIEAP